MRGVDLSNSVVAFADLSDVDLTGANLRNTIFIMSDFSGANLEFSDTTGAVFSAEFLESDALRLLPEEVYRLLALKFGYPSNSWFLSEEPPEKSSHDIRYSAYTNEIQITIGGPSANPTAMLSLTDAPVELHEMEYAKSFPTLSNEVYCKIKSP